MAPRFFERYLMDVSDPLSEERKNAFRTFAGEKDTALSVYEQVFQVNYYGGLRLAKSVLPVMQAQKGAVPQAFMADPQKVGSGIAKHIFSKLFLICPSLSQKIQTLACYLFPVTMGKLMWNMTVRYESRAGE